MTITIIYGMKWDEVIQDKQYKKPPTRRVIVGGKEYALFQFLDLMNDHQITAYTTNEDHRFVGIQLGCRDYIDVTRDTPWINFVTEKMEKNMNAVFPGAHARILYIDY
jgi:hypothetical protein